jgi:hypothetical protein
VVEEREEITDLGWAERRRKVGFSERYDVHWVVPGPFPSRREPLTVVAQKLDQLLATREQIRLIAVDERRAFEVAVPDGHPSHFVSLVSPFRAWLMVDLVRGTRRFCDASKFGGVHRNTTPMAVGA